MREKLTSDQIRDLRPSHFAALGQPCCSRWGKSEIEWVALAYVQALKADGDTWKRLTRNQTYALLSAEQQRDTHGMLTDDFYERWFEMVADQITDAVGALGVHGFWNEHRLLRLLETPGES